MITRKDVGGRYWGRLSHRRKMIAKKQGMLLMKMSWNFAQTNPEAKENQ